MIEPKKARSRFTLRDVAKQAGVSLKTASNAINGSGRMADVTRQRVLDTVERLGYHVNVAARNLNTGRTGFITLAVPGLSAPYLAQLVDRVIEAARPRGYSVYVVTYAPGTASGVRELFKANNATVSDGMILSLAEEEDLSPRDFDVDYPLVCLGARSTHGKADHIATDDIQGARQAAAYLFERDTRSLAVIGSRATADELPDLLGAKEGNAQLRMRGVLEECASRGRAFDPNLLGVIDGAWTIGAGARATQLLIDSAIAFDGIIAFNDQLALGALSTLAVNGMSVPEQVQVIGFDNNEESAYFQPPLTTMDSMLDWIAPTAVERILARIATPDMPPEVFSQPSRVIARATTRACVPAAA